MFYIIHKGPVECVKQVIDAGADLHHVSFYETPLLHACKRGFSNVVKLLISVGSDINYQSIYTSCLHGEVEHYHVNNVKSLISAGVNVNLCDGSRNTALHVACTLGFVNVVKCLIDADANVHAISSMNEHLYIKLVILIILNVRLF